jgi:enamine deaminase RidA (YjgF/YER057c/UK114 family)
VDGPVTSPHEILNPDALAAPRGFSHAVRAAPGRVVCLGGQAGVDRAGAIVEGGIVAQFDRAAANVVSALAAAGAAPEHLVSLHIYVTDVGEYRAALGELGRVYRAHLGRHYPAVALFGVAELFEPEAKVELVGVAIVP